MIIQSCHCRIHLVNRHVGDVYIQNHRWRQVNAMSRKYILKVKLKRSNKLCVEITMSRSAPCIYLPMLTMESVFEKSTFKLGKKYIEISFHGNFHLRIRNCLGSNMELRCTDHFCLGNIHIHISMRRNQIPTRMWHAQEYSMTEQKNKMQTTRLLKT